MDTGKLIVIIAGPNGAGKTTFAREFLSGDLAKLAFLNADEIAAELCPESPESVAIRAGRMMLEQIAERIARGSSFALETTLSGRGYARSIPKWREAGYRVYLHFLCLPDSAIAAKRVAGRVIEGGHSIPLEAIERRHEAGLRNFLDLYKPLVDGWALYDSFQQPIRLIEKGEN